MDTRKIEARLYSILEQVRIIGWNEAGDGIHCDYSTGEKDFADLFQQLINLLQENNT